MYKVIVKFVDLKDGNHVYHVGDEFPHNKTKLIPEERINELKSSANKRRIPLIAEIPDVVPKKDVKEIVKEEIQEESSAVEEPVKEETQEEPSKTFKKTKKKAAPVKRK